MPTKIRVTIGTMTSMKARQPGGKKPSQPGGKATHSKTLPAGVDRECRAALEKLCEGVEPGSGRIRRCFDANEGKLTPSCRRAGVRAKVGSHCHFGYGAKEGRRGKSKLEPTSKLEPKNKIRPDAIRTSGKVQFVDAAKPVHAQASSPS